MARGNKHLDNYEYDAYLSSQKHKKGARKELEQRHAERKNKDGYKGWHWGLGNHPVYCKDKTEFKRELDKRGLMMKDNVRKELK